MSSLGPGDKPAVVRRRAARVKRKDAAKAKRNAQAQQAQHVSQGKSVAREAYKQKPVAARKQEAAAVKRAGKSIRAGKAKLTPDGRAIRAVHHDRRSKDLKDLKEKGYLPRVKERLEDAYAYTPRVLPTNRVELDLDDRIADAGRANKDHVGEVGSQVTTLGVAPNDFEKTLAPLRKKTQSTALTVLDQLERPIHAIAGAADEDVKVIKEKGLGHYLVHGGGSKARKAAVAGVTLKEKKLFSDVLRTAGAPKWVAATAGFGLDVALDPTTYLTLGVGVPAKVAAKGAEKAVLSAGSKAVKAGEMTRVELERKALQTAKEVYDAHPEHAKRAGLRVGVRGSVAKAATGKRVVHSAPLGSRITHAARLAVRAGTTEGARKKAADVVDRAGRQFVHDFRPRDIHPIDHDYIRASSRRYRAAREAADRHAETRARAIHKAVKKAHPRATNEVIADAEATIIHAIEAGVVRNLPEAERDIAMAVQDDLRKAGLQKIDRGLLHTLDIKGPAPEVPAAVDVPAVRAELRAAEKEASALEETHLKSLQGYGVARGRASILSRNVGGTKAERDAELNDIFQGGGHGEEQARAALEEGLAAVHGARTKVEDLKVKLADTEAKHAEYQDQAAAALEHALKPEGYWARHLKDEVFDPDHQRYATPKSGGQRVTGTSLKRRQRSQKIADMTPEEQAEYDLRLAPNVGRHLQETGRAIALSDAHDRLAALGRRVDSMDEVTELLVDYPDAANRLLVREKHGFAPLTDKRGQIDEARARKAFAAGDEVVEVPRNVFDESEALRQRGRNVLERDENVGLRAFDRVQGKIKTAQTAVNPGYHGTNLVGDTFNARLGGTSLRDMTRAIRLKRVEHAMDKAERQLSPQEAKLVRKAREHSETYGDETLSDAELVHEAVEVGAIKSGFAGHELTALTKGEDISTSPSVMDRIRSASEQREDLVRLATYRGARKRGLSPDEASDWVAKHHFDYGDLTEAERGFARRVIPFYTFMARNSRLQVSAVGRAPGTLATYEKARDELAKASEVDPDFAKTLQRYEQQGVPMILPFQVGGNPVVLNAKLPLTDLNNITVSPQVFGENLASRLTVLAKVPVEQLFKLNTFTKKPYTKARVPAPAILSNPLVRGQVNAFFRQLGVDPAIKDIEDPRTGDLIPGWSWRIDELLRQVPATNLGANVGTPTRHDHPQDAALSLIGYGLGPRPSILDGLQVKSNHLWDAHEKLEGQINELKQTVKHKSGAKWKGRIKEMNERLGKLEVSIAKTSKEMGVSDPPFANRIKKGHKRKAAAKAFGASGNGSGMFGAGG